MCEQSNPSAVRYANRYLYLALTIGERMLCSGAEVSRVEDSIRRICKSYGAVQVDVFTITSSIVVTIYGQGFGTVTQTRRISTLENDLNRLEQLNSLSRRIVAEHLPLTQVQAELDGIAAGPRYTFFQQVLIYALISASFALFFGGSGWDALASACIGAALRFVDAAVRWMDLNSILSALVCAGVGGLLAYVSVRLGFGDSVDMISIGNVMLLIPGIKLTNSLRDLFNGDTISGLLRFLEALLVAVIIAFGFVIAGQIGG